MRANSHGQEVNLAVTPLRAGEVLRLLMARYKIMDTPHASVRTQSYGKAPYESVNPG